MREHLTAAVIAFATLLPFESYAKDWELVRTQGKMLLVVVDKAKEANEQIYQDAIRALCVPGKICSIQFWSDRRHVPSNWPMTDAQSDALVASYMKNPNSGFEQFLLSCLIKNDPDKCFR